jgi:hypothetical protein
VVRMVRGVVDEASNENWRVNRMALREETIESKINLWIGSDSRYSRARK